MKDQQTGPYHDPITVTFHRARCIFRELIGCKWTTEQVTPYLAADEAWKHTNHHDRDSFGNPTMRIR